MHCSPEHMLCALSDLLLQHTHLAWCLRCLHVLAAQVFGITRDPFIVWTSNMMAILSLRALYGFVSTMMKQLHYLDKAVALVLAWIGSKMIADFAGVHIDTKVSLGVVATLLAGGVGASLAFPVAHNEDTSTK